MYFLNKNTVVLDWLFNIVLNIFLKTQQDEFYYVRINIFNIHRIKQKRDADAVSVRHLALDV